MINHPIHIHGVECEVTGTDGGSVRPEARWPEVTVDIAVGQMRQIEFLAEEEGDWAMHCHKSHHTMGAMGHGAPTPIGVDHRGLVQRIHHGPQGHDIPRHPSAQPPEQKPWGIAGDPARVTRTVEIRMDDDMRIRPDHLTMREGETLRLRAVNRGRVMHELVLGTPEELAAHAELIKTHAGMVEHHDPHMAHVPPRRRADLV